MRAFLILLFSISLLSGCHQQPTSPVDTSSFEQLNDSQSKLTVTLLSDLSCPSCQKFSNTYYPVLMDEFVENGRVRFKSVIVPFLGSKSFERSSVLKVIELHHIQHYLNAYRLSYSKAVFNSNLEGLATALVKEGLYPGTAKDLLEKANSIEIKKAVKRTKVRMMDQGVRGVPMVLVNGMPMEYQDLSEFRDKLERALLP